MSADIDSVLDEAAAGGLFNVNLTRIGGPGSAMWQASARWRGSDGWLVAIEPTPMAAVLAVIAQRSGPLPILVTEDDLFG